MSMLNESNEAIASINKRDGTSKPLTSYDYFSNDPDFAKGPGPLGGGGIGETRLSPQFLDMQPFGSGSSSSSCSVNSVGTIETISAFDMQAIIDIENPPTSLLLAGAVCIILFTGDFNVNVM